MQSIDEQPTPTKARNWSAVVSLLVAATLWGVFWYPLRWLEAQGLSGLWATFFIYCGTAGAMLVMLRGRLGEFRQAPWLLMGIALASGWCNTTFILAVIEGNVVRVLLLFYLSPVWATALGWLLLGEKLDRLAWFILILAMVGAVIMLWHPQSGYPWPQNHADWMALSSGLGFACTNVLMRKLQNVSVHTKTATGWLGVLFVAGVWILISQSGLQQVSVEVIGSALALGALLLVVMTSSVVYGVTHMPVQRSAVILLFELVAGAVSAQLLTDETIQLQEWWGGGLVILAAYLSARYHNA